MTRSENRTLPFRNGPSLFAGLTFALAKALTRRRHRQLLADLEPHILRDIGLTRDEALAESAKPFWRA